MDKITIGLDTAKSVFHLVLINERGRELKKKKLKRHQLLDFFANLPAAFVAMEACSASHYWCREIEKLGHEVKAIPPQYVLPFRKGNKNDYNDANAIAQAAQREDMRFVPVKSVAQQDIQLIHRVRERRRKQCTALSNQIRGLLSEYGIVISKGIATLRKRLPEILEEADNGLSQLVRAEMAALMEEFEELQARIKASDKQIAQQAKTNSICERLMTMTGIGPLVATALYAAIGNGANFKSGRHLSAWCGLVPKQHSTGDNPKLLGISKRGNGYLRTQFINGARAALRHLRDKDDNVSQWCRRCLERMNFNKACVALANKMLRMAWAMLHHQQDYMPGK